MHSVVALFIPPALSRAVLTVRISSAVPLHYFRAVYHCDVVCEVLAPIMSVCTVYHKIHTGEILPFCISHSPVGLALFLEAMAHGVSSYPLVGHQTREPTHCRPNCGPSRWPSFFTGKDEGPIDLFRRTSLPCLGYVAGSAYRL